MKDKKIVKVDWTQELQDELKKDIEKLNEDFNLEKLEQLIKDETEDDNKNS
jgi:nitrate reductase beta subunit